MKKQYRRCVIFIRIVGQMLSMNKWYKRFMCVVGIFAHFVFMLPILCRVIK